MNRILLLSSACSQTVDTKALFFSSMCYLPLYFSIKVKGMNIENSKVLKASDAFRNVPLISRKSIILEEIYPLAFPFI